MEQGVRVLSPQLELLAHGRSTGWGHGVLLLALPHSTGSTTKAFTPQPGPPASATAPLLNLMSLGKTTAP